MEVYYRVWQDEGPLRGRLAYEQCLSHPLIVVHEGRRGQGDPSLSVADAWIAAAADASPGDAGAQGPGIRPPSPSPSNAAVEAESGRAEGNPA